MGYLVLNEDALEAVDIGKTVLTKRKVLGLVMSQYDPCGLMAPLLLQAKLLLRQLYAKGEGLKWDDPLPADQLRGWTEYLEKSLEMPPLIIPRSIQPEGGRCLTLVGFWDGPLAAHAAILYARWETDDGVIVRLITGKSRVAPVRGTTVQRMELSGLLQCTRLVKRIIRVLPMNVHRVCIAGDSMCAIMVMRKLGSSFKPFFQNRVAEIQADLDIKAKVDVLDPLYKIEGRRNPADVATRNTATPEDILPGGI